MAMYNEFSTILGLLKIATHVDQLDGACKHAILSSKSDIHKRD